MGGENWTDYLKTGLMVTMVMSVVLDLESSCSDSVSLRRYCRWGYIKKFRQELSLLTLFPFQVASFLLLTSTSVSWASDVHFDIPKFMRPRSRETNHDWVLLL
ncbi:hypothetical protein AVEN_158744-1 [Araneus ventricosus]|uniref:Uncharacterized protein n=1 Tax=Araneus ventricosus TaxID=182803 RepID=A0A4Y2X4M3_ARAVE|nr:hypothetical protein AVEN_2028-1 [Araneus ventricosus]GBO42954.1 hypothetical protein AVEN_264219-1 [Araneus ventricosus]GBO42956.1 hypothetical protein AVEN_14491-1 [Araneus ventricosus]GBO42957.1 hypothetical protein AVEN_158744-1 [Araneus ventricosus]